MGETNSPSVAHMGYDISPLSWVKLKNLTFTPVNMEIENHHWNIISNRNTITEDWKAQPHKKE
jgi:hypothetical protein